MLHRVKFQEVQEGATQDESLGSLSIFIQLMLRYKSRSWRWGGCSFCAAGVNFFRSLKQKRWNHGSQLLANMTPLSWSELHLPKCPSAANMLSQQSTERISHQYSAHTIKNTSTIYPNASDRCRHNPDRLSCRFCSWDIPKACPNSCMMVPTFWAFVGRCRHSK